MGQAAKHCNAKLQGPVLGTVDRELAQDDFIADQLHLRPEPQLLAIRQGHDQREQIAASEVWLFFENEACR